jgi:hypothetical protein
MSEAITNIPSVSDEVTQIEDRMDKIVSSVNTLQTIVLATLAVSIIAVVLPFVRKN